MRVYGADKVCKQLNRERIAVARCTVKRLMKQVAVAMRALGRSGDLDLDDQQGQRDCEDRVGESLEAVKSRSAPCVSAAVDWLSLRSVM